MIQEWAFKISCYGPNAIWFWKLINTWQSYEQVRQWGGLTYIHTCRSYNYTPCNLLQFANMCKFYERRSSSVKFMSAHLYPVQTHKQAVNDISTPCLSACMENNNMAYSVVNWVMVFGSTSLDWNVSHFSLYACMLFTVLTRDHKHQVSRFQAVWCFTSQSTCMCLYFDFLSNIYLNR